MTPVLQALARRPRTYVEQFINLVKTHKVESVYIFGSQIKGFSTDISDIDLFVILQDDITKEELSLLDRKIHIFEEEHGYRKNSTMEDKFLNLVNEKIGMFLNHYLWKKEDFLQARVHKIYRVSPFAVFAPANIVLSTAFSQMKLVHGKELRPDIKPLTVNKTEIVKSLLCNMILSTAQLPFYLVSGQATKYSMESIKWTLYSCSVVDDVRETKLREISLYYSEHFAKKYLETLFALREKYAKNFLFTFATPWYVLKLHLISMFR